MYKLCRQLKFPDLYAYITKLESYAHLNSLECVKLCDSIGEKLYQISSDPNKLVNACLRLSFVNNIERNLFFRLKRCLVASINNFDASDNVAALEALGNFNRKGFNVQNIPKLLYKNLLSNGQIRCLDLDYIPKLLHSLHVFDIENAQIISEIEKKIKMSIKRLYFDHILSQELLKYLCLVAPKYKLLIGSISEIIFTRHTETMKASELLESYYYMAKANFYPTFSDRIDNLFINMFDKLEVDSILHLLHCYSLHYARITPVLDKIVIKLREISHFLPVENAIDAVYNLYKLRIYDEKIVDSVNNGVLNAQIDKLGAKRLINYSTAITFFKIENHELYNKVLPQITRHLSCLKQEGITQLKIIELALRLNHIKYLYSQLSESSLHLLQLVREMTDKVESLNTSNFQKQVGEAAVFTRYKLNTEVKIGPFTVDFATPMSVKEMYSIAECRNIANNNTGPISASEGVIIEADGPKHFYKNSRTYTCHSILKDEILSLMGYKVVHVKYFEWEELPNLVDKQAYLLHLINSAIQK